MKYSTINKDVVSFQLPTPTAGIDSVRYQSVLNSESFLALARHSKMNVEITEINEDRTLPDDLESSKIKVNYKKGVRLKPLDHYDRD